MAIFNNSKKYQIDLNAEIIPYKSAGGFELGIMKNDIDKKELAKFEYNEIINKYLPEHPPLIEYKTEDIILHFYENKLNQIGLIGNYAGKLKSNLGLGDLVKDFEKVYGLMTEGDEEELIFANLNGLCFEVDNEKYNSDNWRTAIPNLPVTEIYIYGKDIYNKST
jgi:hypothetical protein